MDSARDLEQFIRVWDKQGWYPAKWAHHPPEVKRVFREHGWRPMKKECFRNAQRFVVDAQEHGLDVEYREGWVISIIPIEHGWVQYRGEPLELTLDPGDGTQYLDSTGYTAADVLQNVLAHHAWCQIDPRKLQLQHPLRAQFDQLLAMEAGR